MDPIAALFDIVTGHLLYGVSGVLSVIAAMLLIAARESAEEMRGGEFWFFVCGALICVVLAVISFAQALGTGGAA